MINRATINDLQRLCKVNSPQVMLIFVKNHLAEINRDGEHAEKIGKSWLFDEIAVKRIMELRAQTTHARADKETPEQAEIRQARIVVTKAQQQIIMLQNKTIEDAQHIIKLLQRADQDLPELIQNLGAAVVPRLIQRIRHFLQPLLQRNIL